MEWKPRLPSTISHRITPPAVQKEDSGFVLFDVMSVSILSLAGGRRSVCCTWNQKTFTTTGVAMGLWGKMLYLPSFPSTMKAGTKRHEVAPALVDRAVTVGQGRTFSLPYFHASNFSHIAMRITNVTFLSHYNVIIIKHLISWAIERSRPSSSTSTIRTHLNIAAKIASLQSWTSQAHDSQGKLQEYQLLSKYYVGSLLFIVPRALLCM